MTKPGARRPRCVRPPDRQTRPCVATVAPVRRAAADHGQGSQCDHGNAVGGSEGRRVGGSEGRDGWRVRSLTLSTGGTDGRARAQMVPSPRAGPPFVEPSASFGGFTRVGFRSWLHHRRTCFPRALWPSQAESKISWNFATRASGPRRDQGPARPPTVRTRSPQH